MFRLTNVGAIAALIFVTSPALAEGDASTVCPTVGQLAEKVMKLRQIETPLSDMMAAATKDEGAAALGKALVMMAYEEPSYSVPENQRQAVAEFRNKVELSCYQQMGAN